MKICLIAIGLSTSILLSACASTPQDAQETLYTAEAAYAAALAIAVQYENLPSCGANAPSLCSDPKIVSQINQASAAAQAAFNAANTALTTAPAGSSQTTTDISATLAALQAIVVTLKVQ